MAKTLTISINSEDTERKIVSVLDDELADDGDLYNIIDEVLLYIDELTGDQRLHITLSIGDRIEKTTVYGDPDKIALYLTRCVEGFKNVSPEEECAIEEDDDGDPHDESTPGFEPFIDYSDLD